MATLKTLTIGTALLLGGVSLAIAQGPATGGYPPVAGGAGGNPATNPVTSGPPGPGVIPMPNTQSTAPARQATRHHLYMSNRTHKGSKMNQ
jgi:hypothetical protein